MSNITKSSVAISVPFDNSTNGFTSTEVQSAIEESANGGGTGASPGYQYTRSGTSSSGTYLQVGSVPSNTTGAPVGLSSARITAVIVSNESTNTFSIVIEEHDGTTYTTLGTYSLTAERSHSFTGLSIPVTAGKELSVKVGSGSCKNIVTTLYVKGNTV